MNTAPQELMKEYVQSQHFTSTAEIMTAMKEMFRDVVQTVMEVEMDEELGRERCQRAETSCAPNYRNGYTKKTVKTQLGEVDIRVPRDRNGSFEPKIIGKYSRNADGMEEKIIGLYASGMSQRDMFVIHFQCIVHIDMNLFFPFFHTDLPGINADQNAAERCLIIRNIFLFFFKDHMYVNQTLFRHIQRLSVPVDHIFGRVPESLRCLLVNHIMIVIFFVILRGRNCFQIAGIILSFKLQALDRK